MMSKKGINNKPALTPVGMVFSSFAECCSAAAEATSEKKSLKTLSRSFF